MKLLAQIGFLIAVLVVNCSAQTASNAGAERQTAITLEQQGSYADSEIAWRAVLKVSPKSGEAYAHCGFLEARQGHYTEAIPLYRKALALNPAMPGLRLNLGLALFKSGAMREAIQMFTPLLKDQSSSSPESQRLTILIGMAHYGLGEYAAAVPYLKQAASRDPQSLELRMTLVQSCLGSKQYDCVLDVYHQIVLLNADSAEADILAGEALDELHDEPGAIQQFRAAAKANPKEPNVHFGLGYLLWKLKQYGEAAQEFEAELNNFPDSIQALAYLGDSRMMLQDPEGALPLLEKAVRLDPKLELPHLDLGILYSDAQRRDEALRELKLAAKLNPNDVTVHWRLARLYRAAGEKDEAQAEFDKTRQLHEAADNTILNKLHETHSTVKTAE